MVAPQLTAVKHSSLDVRLCQKTHRFAEGLRLRALKQFLTGVECRSSAGVHLRVAGKTSLSEFLKKRIKAPHQQGGQCIAVSFLIWKSVLIQISTLFQP